MKGQLAAGRAAVTSAQRVGEEQRHLRNVLSKAADEAQRAGQLPYKHIAFPENPSLWRPLFMFRRKWLHRKGDQRMGSQSEKDLIKDTDRPSLGRAFPPFNYQEGAFVGLMWCLGGHQGLITRWLVCGL